MFKKPRSKSGGHTPSRSASELDLTVGDNKRRQEEDLMLENEDELVERLEILGSLTDNLDRKRIDGRELDKVVRSLFDKYQAEQGPRYDTERFIAIHSCKNSRDIEPPQGL